MEKFVLIALLAWQALGAFAVIASIGKFRKPITHGQAIFALITAILSMTGVCYLAGTL